MPVKIYEAIVEADRREAVRKLVLGFVKGYVSACVRNGCSINEAQLVEFRYSFVDIFHKVAMLNRVAIEDNRDLNTPVRLVVEFKPACSVHRLGDPNEFIVVTERL